MQISELIRAFTSEQDISEELVKKTIEDSLLAAYKKSYGTDENAEVIFKDDEVSIYARKEIVEELYDPVSEIELSEAIKLNSDAEIGDQLLIKIDPKTFDRNAIQSAKQKTKQNIRDIRKDTLYSEFKNKVGEMVIGYYQRERNGTVIVDLGKTEGILPRRFQNPRETYRPNDRIKALIHEVNLTPSGLQIVLTRTHDEFIQKIFELEVPEIYDKTVEVYKIVRSPGYRTKIAVYSNRLDVDPVGACVGLKGVRIQAIVRELEGEKIDILNFATDPSEFIQNALSPANIKQVYILDEQKKQALAIVEDDQLSLAIGKQGLNVRLANRLVDWTIEVKTEEQFAEMDISIATKQAVSNLFSEEEVEIIRIAQLPGISARLVAILNRDNIEYIEDLISLSQDEMIQLNGITESDVNFLQNILNKSLILEEESAEPNSIQKNEKPALFEEEKTEQEELAKEEASNEELTDEEEISHISELPNLPTNIVKSLEEGGVSEIIDLINLSDEELLKIPNITESDLEIIQKIIKESIDVIEEDDES